MLRELKKLKPFDSAEDAPLKSPGHSIPGYLFDFSSAPKINDSIYGGSLYAITEDFPSCGYHNIAHVSGTRNGIQINHKKVSLYSQLGLLAPFAIQVCSLWAPYGEVERHRHVSAVAGRYRVHHYHSWCFIMIVDTIFREVKGLR